MTPAALYALGVTGLVAGLLVFTRIGPDLVFVGGLTLLLVAGVLTPSEALAGFSNPGLASVAVLYVVAAGLVDTGGIYLVGQRLLGRPRAVAAAQCRLMLPVAGISVFLNNTPVVAMMVPVVQDWCKRNRLPVSKLMIPLSYAAILGGTCSLIGTSTNLVVYGLVVSRTDLGSMGMFDIAWVGLPSAIAGILFVIAVSRWLLPDRQPPLHLQQDPREYTIEMLVEPGSPLGGKTIEEAGLRHLPGTYLAEIERGGSLIPAVAPTERLQGGDRLLFVGIIESVVDLVKIKGLVPAPDQLFKLDAPRAERRLIEAVVSNTCPVVGKTIRDGRFRSIYEAVVIALAREGRRVPGKVGDIVLHAGDTLLLEARPSFVELHWNSRDFLLVSAIEGSTPPRHERAGLALLILGAMVVTVATGLMPMLEAALVAGGLMIFTRCTNGPSARQSVDWTVLIVIAASLGLGQALHTTGAAEAVARFWIGLAGGSPWLALLAVYGVTSGLTAFISNNAAAVLVFPIAQATAASLGVSLWPFVIAVMMAASACFATPVGYQTNLMVYGPGAYRFVDFIRIGLGLNAVMALISMAVIPLVWPF